LFVPCCQCSGNGLIEQFLVPPGLLLTCRVSRESHDHDGVVEVGLDLGIVDKSAGDEGEEDAGAIEDESDRRELEGRDG
jgi:hypothetical protein